jgi:hypothetical protein
MVDALADGRDDVELDTPQPNCSRWWIKRCSPPLCRSGSNHRPSRARTETREETDCGAAMTPCMPCRFGLVPTPGQG